MTVTDLIMHDLQCGNITVEKALKLIFREANRMLYVIPKKMKNKIIIEGEEFELPDDLVNDIKERFKMKVTYYGVMTYLYKDKPAYYITHDGDILKDGRFSKLSNNCNSENQAKKLLAINKLMNVAKYLNGDWQPDWHDNVPNKFHLYIEYGNEKIKVTSYRSVSPSVVYFKTEELAEQAVEILGEDVIRTALSTDW